MCISGRVLRDAAKLGRGGRYLLGTGSHNCRSASEAAVWLVKRGQQGAETPATRTLISLLLIVVS